MTKHVWKGKRVGVLFGGVSRERPVSLMTGRAVCEALGARDYEVLPIEINHDRASWFEKIFEIDVAFIALHGKFGEDGTVQGFLEWANIPYTGSGILASALAMNKPTAKQIWQSAGLPTARWRVVDRPEIPVLPEDLPFPLIVKPAKEGMSIGVSLAHSPEDLQLALEEAFRHDSRALIEEYVPGREITVGILGDFVLGSMEVLVDDEFNSHEVKCSSGREQLIIPPQLTPEAREVIVSMAWAAHCALGCSSHSRIDMRLRDTAEVVLLELNTLPGLSPVSYFPPIAAYAGIGYEDLVESILDQATLHIPHARTAIAESFKDSLAW